MRATIRIIGKAIRDGSHYTPVRYRAARLASTARPKDYLGQARAVYNDFLRRWRYVKDPADRELITTSPVQIYETIMGGDDGIGHGDCDDATVGIGAQMSAIGFQVRICTIAPQGTPAGRMMSHVFPQVHVAGRGWVTMDPVVHPEHGFGYLPPHSRLVTWGLNGQIIEQYGNTRGMQGDQGVGEMDTEYDQYMGSVGNVEQWTDFAGLGDSNPDPLNMLPDFRSVIRDFGIYSEKMGIMDGMGLVAEVDVDETGRAWTPALELAPDDYDYMKSNSTPYQGMLALGDNGSQYVFDGGLGFFRKLFRKIKKKVSKVARKVLKRIPGGKYLLKLGSKVWKIAKKFVRPLAKFVGKWATKLAPIAALIPGYGPAIAAAMYTAGKVARLMTKYDVMLTGGGKGKPKKIRFKSGKHAKRFQRALKKTARSLKRSKSKRQILRMAKSGGSGGSSRRRSGRRRTRGSSRGRSRFSKLMRQVRSRSRSALRSRR